MDPFMTHIYDQFFTNTEVIITPNIRADIAFMMTGFGPLWEVADIEGEHDDPAVVWTFEQFAGLILPLQSVVYLLEPLTTDEVMDEMSVELVAQDIIDLMMIVVDGLCDALQGDYPFGELGPIALATGLTEAHLDSFGRLIGHVTVVPDPLMVDDVRGRLAAGDPCKDVAALVDAGYGFDY